MEFEATPAERELAGRARYLRIGFLIRAEITREEFVTGRRQVLREFGELHDVHNVVPTNNLRLGFMGGLFGSEQYGDDGAIDEVERARLEMIREHPRTQAINWLRKNNPDLYGQAKAAVALYAEANTCLNEMDDPPEDSEIYAMTLGLYEELWMSEVVHALEPYAAERGENVRDYCG